MHGVDQAVRGFYCPRCLTHYSTSDAARRCAVQDATDDDDAA